MVYRYFDTEKRGVLSFTCELQNPSERYVRLNQEQMEFFNNNRHATYDEIWQAHKYVPPTPTPEQLLEMAKINKINEIREYDTSDNVNGFYLNGNLRWLDKDTRTTLANTINSMKSVGRDTLTIWFDSDYIEVGLDLAKQLLAVLEVYATDCYNVTSAHINAVSALQTVEAVNAFDVTFGYPSRPDFDIDSSTNE